MLLYDELLVAHFYLFFKVDGLCAKTFFGPFVMGMQYNTCMHH